MVYGGDLTLYHPGQHVTVEVEADAGGNVATRGQAVELIGEGSDNPRVQIVSADGNGIGQIDNDPVDYDENATYADGDFVGTTTLEVSGPVEWYDPADNYAAPAVGDEVVYAAGGGVDLYDDDATAPDDPPTAVVGQVFTTSSTEFINAGKVAVYRYR